MPLTPQEYEELVKILIDSLLKNNDVLKIENVRYGKGNKIEGASSHKHQIDIAYRDLQNQSLILVECKRWQSKIKIEHVLAFHCRLEDIRKKQNVILKELWLQLLDIRGAPRNMEINMESN